MHWTFYATENLREVARGRKAPHPFVRTAPAQPKGPFFMGRAGVSPRFHMFAGAAIIWDPSGNARLGAIGHCGTLNPNAAPFMEPPEDSEACDECLLAGTVSHVVYRFFDADQTLLYVGYSAKFAQRLRVHTTQSKWWPEVKDWRLEYFDTEITGRAAESSAIFREGPKYNVAGKPRHLHVAA